MKEFEIFKANRMIFMGGGGGPKGGPSEQPNAVEMAEGGTQTVDSLKSLSAGASEVLNSTEITEARKNLEAIMNEAEKEAEKGVFETSNKLYSTKWSLALVKLLQAYSSKLISTKQSDYEEYSAKIFIDLNILLTRFENYEKIRLRSEKGSTVDDVYRYFARRFRARLILFDSKQGNPQMRALASAEAEYNVEFEYNVESMNVNIQRCRKESDNVVRTYKVVKKNSSMPAISKEGKELEGLQMKVFLDSVRRFFSYSKELVRNIYTIYTLYRKIPKSQKTPENKKKVKEVLQAGIKDANKALIWLKKGLSPEWKDLHGEIDAQLEYLKVHIEPLLEKL